MSLEILILYTIISFFYIISPGPAIFMAIANGLTGPMKNVLFSSLGNISGLFLLSTVSILGLGALFIASSSLFLAVKIIGALYLLYLGIKQIRLARHAKIDVDESLASPQKKSSLYFKEGFFMASTNPKAILFFTALFPQFLDITQNITLQFFIMTAIFMLLSLCSLLSYAVIFKQAKGFLNKGSRMSWFHRITGGIFIGMGALLLQLKSQ